MKALGYETVRYQINFYKFLLQHPPYLQEHVRHDKILVTVLRIHNLCAEILLELHRARIRNKKLVGTYVNKKKKPQ